MAENGNPTRKDAGVAVPSSQVQIVITWDQVTGAINLQGPIQNSVLCYGILHSAMDVVQKFIADNQSPIVKPHGLSVVGN